MNEPRMTLTDGQPVPEDGSHRTIDPTTGLQKGYVVLSEEERAKRFVKPVRRTYIHGGHRVCGKDLGEYGQFSTYYGEGARRVCHEDKGHTGECGENGNSVYIATLPEFTRLQTTGRYKGCDGSTTMSRALAETYARDPKFYSGTFCCNCHKHFPLDEFQWEDGEPMEPNLQEAHALVVKAARAKMVEDARIARERSNLAHTLAVDAEFPRETAVDPPSLLARIATLEQQLSTVLNYVQTIQIRQEELMGLVRTLSSQWK